MGRADGRLRALAPPQVPTTAGMPSRRYDIRLLECVAAQNDMEGRLSWN
jgi:hypothetical protein